MSVPILPESVLRTILTLSDAAWFVIEEHDPAAGTATLSSREFGDVGEETPGQKDIDAARRIRTTIKTAYPQFKCSGDTVDEWVTVNILPKPE